MDAYCKCSLAARLFASSLRRPQFLALKSPFVLILVFFSNSVAVLCTACSAVVHPADLITVIPAPAVRHLPLHFHPHVLPSLSRDSRKVPFSAYVPLCHYSPPSAPLFPTDFAACNLLLMWLRGVCHFAKIESFGLLTFCTHISS
jgi:hypothetical protein